MKVYRWKEMVPEKVMGQVSRRLIHGEKITLGYFELPKGSSVPSHSHENEQLANCLRGTILFEIDGQKIELTEGEVLHIPPGAEHAVDVIEDALVLDIFSPPRDDWR
ncbi:MAG: cupin domain-containing protein [Desulfatiglandales bacterium]